MTRDHLLPPALCLALALGYGPVTRAEAPAAADSQADLEFFESNVRPLLLESCVRCHGEKKQSAGLRLDSREALLKGGDSGPAIEPGNPSESLLVQALSHELEDIKMPPKGKLDAPKIDAIAQWVSRGAAWPTGVILSAAEMDAATGKHWSFQPISPTPPGKVHDQSWVKTPIDAYILAKLEAQGVKPSPRADRRTLIRRASFDLVGLPPTADQIEAFESDSAPDAWAKVIDRLLASPQYGERWGRHWLDVARYADTKGYVFNEERRYPYSYTYRDYVIKSFNDDLPYNQFIIEQIAADRLPKAETDRDGSLAAMGFLTVGRRFLNNQQDIIDDRIDVVTRGLLGLTVSCARCHDHKFDPIPIEDYYSLYGVFASSVEPGDLPVLPEGPSKSPETLDFERETAKRTAKRDDYLAQKRREFQDDLIQRADVYLVAAITLDLNARHPKLDDRARADSLPTGRLRLAISRWKARLTQREGRSSDPVFGLWPDLSALSDANFKQGVTDLIAKKGDSWNPIVLEAFKNDPPASRLEAAQKYGELLKEARERAKSSGKGADTSESRAWTELAEVLSAPGGIADLASEDIGRALDRSERNRFRQLNNEISALAASHAGAPPRAMVLNDLPQPVNPHVFLRGNPGRPGAQVPRQFLQVLAGPTRKPFSNGSGRLDLAQAIIDPKNPLTARVLVNRVWMLHFGTGLVATASDFGLRSEPPTHPELLDDLAAEFVRSGWSLKTLHRRIMLSNVYQQRSDLVPASEKLDPSNKLLWRYPRKRLEFEPMRDALLAVSGQLDPTLGGRSVDLAKAPYTGRRTVYGLIDRQNLDGLYRTFDFASPDATSPKRFVTTVPQQALFLLNSPFVMEQARHLAQLTEKESIPEARVRAIYRRVLGRAPEAFEIDRALAFLQQQTLVPNQVSLDPWELGYGGIDEASSKVAEFTRFPHWTGDSWQFSGSIPDPQFGHLYLKVAGGHVGKDSQHAAIRRWRAPEAGVIQIEGTLGHRSPQGDGVRGRIVASEKGNLGDWISHNARTSTKVDRYEVKAGETIDFVVDCRTNPSFDSFEWAPVIKYLAPGTKVWNATDGFKGPSKPPLSPWEEYAQVLMLTNEFVFVD